MIALSGGGEQSGEPKLHTNEDPSPDAPRVHSVADNDVAAGTGDRLRRGDRTRVKILDAAEKVFGEHGYHNASIVEITREAGVGLGTFYVYFPSKIEIYRHLLRAHIEDFVRVARAVTSGGGDSGGGDYRRVVRDSFGVFFQWIGKRPGVLRLMREADFVDPSLLQDMYGGPAGEYKKRLKRAMELGYIAETDADVLAWAMMGMTEFMAMRYLAWPGTPAMDPERFDAFVDIMVRALGAEGRAAAGA